MKNWIKIVCAVVVSAGFLGCDDAKKTVKNISEQPEMQGKFLSSCEAFGVDGMASISVQDELDFVGNQLTVNSILYAHSDCNGDSELGRITYEGEFEVERLGLEKVAANYDALTEKEREVLDAGSISIKLEDAKIKATDQTLVSLLNGVSFCGKSDYQLDNEHKLTESSDEVYCPLKSVPAELLGGYTYNEDTKEVTLSEAPTSMSEDSSQPNASDEERQQEAEDNAEDSVVVDSKWIPVIDVFASVYKKK